MKFMLISNWDPQNRDEFAKRRMENGRMVPKGINIISEWLDASGGRQVLLYESDSAMDSFKWSNRWSDLASFECFPVVEVKDDKATEMS